MQIDAESYERPAEFLKILGHNFSNIDFIYFNRVNTFSKFTQPISIVPCLKHNLPNYMDK